MDELKRAFEREAVASCRLLKSNYGYNPSYYLRMVSDHGALLAAKLLLASTHPQAGLTKLWEIGRLDLSIEAMVLDTKWSLLFTDQEVATARKRLRDLNYTP